MKKPIAITVIIIIAIIILFILGPFYIINEGEQAVVTRFGKIVNNTTTSGLKVKVPIVDHVVKYPKKILSWDGEAQRIPTKENQFIWVDTTARWKIVDPVKFYEAVKSVNTAYYRLNEVLDSNVRTIISENHLNEAVRSTNKINDVKVDEQVVKVDNIKDAESLRNLTKTSTKQEQIHIGRDGLSQKMLDEANKFVGAYGIEIIDLIIRQIKYSKDLTQSVYQRMIKEREQIAEAYRSYGSGQNAMWLGKAENEKKQILSEAYAKSEEIKGKADAEASKIYSQAYESNYEFFDLWRTLDSYKQTLIKTNKILSTDNPYFKVFYNK